MILRLCPEQALKLIFYKFFFECLKDFKETEAQEKPTEEAPSYSRWLALGSVFEEALGFSKQYLIETNTYSDYFDLMLNLVAVKYLLLIEPDLVNSTGFLRKFLFLKFLFY